MPHAKLFAAVDEHLSEYEKGTITISDDIEFSMRYTVRQITHYILSKYMGGQLDDQGRRKPFRNIGNAIVDLEWRAKNIDRKSIEAHALDDDHIFSLIVNKELQLWMKTNNFGKTIDDYQRKKSEYGSVLLKKTETSDKLLIEPVKWENTAVDPRNIAGGIKLEKDTFTLLDLKKKRGIWDDDAIEELVSAARIAKKHDVDVFDIEGEFERCDIEDTPEGEAEDDTIALYNVIIGQVQKKRVVLYYTELTESRYKHDKRKEAENRDFGIGVWEEVTEPQIWTNEAVISEHEAMEIAGKVVVTTNKKGLPSAMQLVNGEVIDLEADEYFKPVSLAPQTLPEFQNQIDNWFVNTQRDQSAYPGMTGEEPKASTPFQSLALQAAQSASIFNKRRDQDGFFLLEVLVDWVLPFIIKKINKTHTLTASYSPRELHLLDEAIKEWMLGEHMKSIILSPDFMDPQTPMPTEAYKQAVKDQAQAHLSKNGSKRTLTVPKGYITLQRIQEKVRFDITDEMSDDQRRLNGLATALGALEPGDPQRNAFIEEMMEITGISPASFPVSGTPPAPQQQPQQQMPQMAGTQSPQQVPPRVNGVLPQAQQA